MTIPTEPVGSLPRPTKLQEAIAAYDAGDIEFAQLTEQQDAACRDSIERMEATGSVGMVMGRLLCLMTDAVVTLATPGHLSSHLRSGAVGPPARVGSGDA